MKIPLVEIESVKRLSFGKESHLHGCHPRGKASTDIFQRSFIWERTRSQHIYHLSTHKIILLLEIGLLAILHSTYFWLQIKTYLTFWKLWIQTIWNQTFQTEIMTLPKIIVGESVHNPLWDSKSQECETVQLTKIKLVHSDRSNLTCCLCKLHWASVFVRAT